MKYTKSVEKWGVFELSCEGSSSGNPFTDHHITATFESGHERKTVAGFYDGDGVYKVRFMPSHEGIYHFNVTGNFSGESYCGEFTVTPPAPGNHGPVGVCRTFHFAYADGTPYYPFGTTCYVWELQSDELISQTLHTLKRSPFNKIRFCVFPKSYCYNSREPRSYPYEGTPVDGKSVNEDNVWDFGPGSEGNNWDFSRFNPEYFRHIEKCILELQQLGTEADIILFHPYDRWGFSTMNKEQNELYLQYVASRFSAYRNIWWSFANEYDFIGSKTEADWERFAEIICESDPYHHLRSIHNGVKFYDHSRPWITHCSIQRSPEGTTDWRGQYGKPIVLDEMQYEGNIPFAWGNISAQELVRRHWEALCRGGYGGHGETYVGENLWWAHGGELKGESPARIAFMRQILEAAPAGGLKPKAMEWDEICVVPEDETAEKESGYHLFYYGIHRPAFRWYHIDDENRYSVEVIDTWNMTITKIGEFAGRFRVDLPGREYMALRVKKCDSLFEFCKRNCPA